MSQNWLQHHVLRMGMVRQTYLDLWIKEANEFCNNTTNGESVEVEI